MRTAAVVLAAGMSSRMGVNKLLLPVDGEPVLGHILSSLGGLHTVVVTGHTPDKLEHIITRHRASSVHNPDYQRGMTTSFQAGLRALNDRYDAVFLVLGDTFGFSPELLDSMTRMMQLSGAVLVSPVYEGKRGHPVLVHGSLFGEFLELGEDETMKTVVDRHEEGHSYVEGDVWTRLDMDTPEDYERVKRLWLKRRA